MNKRVVFLGFFIALVLLSSTFMEYQNACVTEDSQTRSVIQKDTVDRSQLAYAYYAPFSITGDEDLKTKAEEDTWEGNGTLEEPYIIEGYNITLSGAAGSCITLTNISRYVVVRDCLIGNATYGVWLYNVTNFVFTRNIIYDAGYGMYILLCNHSIITDTAFDEAYYPIYVEDSLNMNIEGCQFITSQITIDGSGLAYSWIVNNTIIDAEYGILLEPGCIGDEIRQNSFTELTYEGVILALGVSKTKVLWNYFGGDSPGCASDYSSPSSNEFSHNYYFGFTSFDLDNDGICDESYSIIGPSGLRDYSPLMYPPLPPSWALEPTDFEIEIGSSCFHQLDVNSYPPIASWRVNDTIHFEIDQDGVLLDRGNLLLGEYGLEVNATDLYGQSVTGVFKVTVVDNTYPILVTAVQDVSFYYGEEVVIQIIAWDNSWIEEWSLSDTGNFSITWESFGELSVATIESMGSLELGFYPLHLTVFDSSGLMVATSFDVTIEQMPVEGAPLVWIVVPSGLAAAAIVIGLLSLLRTRKESNPST